MRIAILFALLVQAVAAVAASNDPAAIPATSRMLDAKLTVAQRNNACYSLRGDTSKAAVEAATLGLCTMQKIRACSAENLRPRLSGRAAEDSALWMKIRMSVRLLRACWERSSVLS